MEEKISGIVLSKTAYGDNDEILNIFSLEKGTVSAKIKGVKKAGAKLKFAAEPFCFAEYILLEKGGYRTVINASLIDSFYPIRENIRKFFSAGAVVEFIRKFAFSGIVSPELFMSAVNCFKELAYSDSFPESSLIRFFAEGLSLIGYALNTSGCEKCKNEPNGKVYFDHSAGCFYCGNCFDGRGREINPLTYKALKDTVENKAVESQYLINPLKLIDYYIEMKTGEKITSLKELIKMTL